MDELLKIVAGNTVFGTMLVILWLYYEKTVTRKETQIKSKDDELRILNEKVLTAFIDNTKMTEAVKTTVENNTKAVEQLTDRIYKVLTDKK